MAQSLATSETAARAAMATDIVIAPNASEASLAAQMPAPVDREQAIREAAYALFEARGSEPGHELDDWLRAEAQLQRANGELASSGTDGQIAH